MAEMGARAGIAAGDAEGPLWVVESGHSNGDEPDGKVPPTPAVRQLMPGPQRFDPKAAVPA